MKIEQIVFDCDGVLLDSVGIKTKAFSQLAEKFGSDIQAQFVAYHQANGGVSRVEKFKWLYHVLLRKEATEVELANMAAEFAHIIKIEMQKCPMVNGALEFLEAWHTKMPLYVCSGTPQVELQNILQQRRLDIYFQGVYGTPPEKAVLLQTIVEKSHILPEATLMVGDAITDFEAAQKNCTHFYGINFRADIENITGWHDLTKLADFIAKEDNGTFAC